jgi:hypothetical protein
LWLNCRGFAQIWPKATGWGIPRREENPVLAYKITNWVEAPGPREAHVVVTREMRELSRRRTRERIRRICRALEERETPQVCRAVGEVTRALGFERAQELVAEARVIFEGPGMLVRNGSRRRTVGGIFFQLARASGAVSPPGRPPR